MRLADRQDPKNPGSGAPFDELRTFYFWKGRVALYGILKALGIGPGDDVVVPGFTCVVVPQAVRFAGARPIYVDICEETFNLDANQLRSVLTPNTKAIIVQHTFGLAADVEAIKSIAVPRGIKIIEDCAHSMGTLYHGAWLGTLGDAAYFSTQWTKPITTGLGGIAVTRDPEIAKGLAAFEQETISPSFREKCALYVQCRIHQAFFRPSIYWTARDTLRLLARMGLFVGSNSSEELSGLKPDGYEKRMGPFQRRRLKTQMAGLRASSDHRIRVAQAYEELINQIGLTGPTVLEGTEPVMLRYPVLVSDKPRTLDAARRARIEIGEWFVSPLHPLTEGLEQLGYRPGECPIAEEISRRVINLPTHTGVDAATIARIGEFLRNTEGVRCGQVRAQEPVPSYRLANKHFS